METRQDMISNELSWSSFGHPKGLQISAASQDIFPVLALRPWLSDTTLNLGTAPLPESQQKTLGLNEKDILEVFEENHSKVSSKFMLEVIFHLLS